MGNGNHTSQKQKKMKHEINKFLNRYYFFSFFHKNYLILKSELVEISIPLIKLSSEEKHTPLSLFSFMQIDKFQMEEEREQKTNLKYYFKNTTKKSGEKTS